MCIELFIDFLIILQMTAVCFMISPMSFLILVICVQTHTHAYIHSLVRDFSILLIFFFQRINTFIISLLFFSLQIFCNLFNPEGNFINSKYFWDDCTWRKCHAPSFWHPWLLMMDGHPSGPPALCCTAVAGRKVTFCCFPRGIPDTMLGVRSFHRQLRMKVPATYLTFSNPPQ